MTSENQVMATFTHADGAVMTYDILGTQHLATNQTPIVLIGGMACRKVDWEYLANGLSTIRPVLLLDHRGIGDSTYSTRGNDTITIESYARDVLDLLLHLKWKKLALCGFSMGGTIVQQILLLPHHATNPTPPHPFTITHVFLTGTYTTPLRRKHIIQKLGSVSPPTQMSKKGRKEIVRPFIEANLDKSWLADVKNRERFDVLLERFIIGRPAETVFRQARACSLLDFKAPQSLISPKIPILVIHGENDQVVPFSSAMEILSFIPHARFVPVGPNPGQLPNLKFGHLWIEYFDAQVWVDVFERFLEAGGTVEAKL